MYEAKNSRPWHHLNVIDKFCSGSGLQGQLCQFMQFLAGRDHSSLFEVQNRYLQKLSLARKSCTHTKCFSFPPNHLLQHYGKVSFIMKDKKENGSSKVLGWTSGKSF